MKNLDMESKLQVQAWLESYERQHASSRTRWPATPLTSTITLYTINIYRLHNFVVPASSRTKEIFIKFSITLFDN